MSDINNNNNNINNNHSDDDDYDDETIEQIRNEWFSASYEEDADSLRHFQKQELGLFFHDLWLAHKSLNSIPKIEKWDDKLKEIDQLLIRVSVLRSTAMFLSIAKEIKKI